MLRPTFESYKPPMRRRCKFIPATRLQEALKVVEPLKGHVQPMALHNFAIEIAPEE